MLDLEVNNAGSESDGFTGNVIQMKTVISERLNNVINHELDKSINHEKLVRELLTRLSNSINVRFRSCCIDGRDDRETIPGVSIPGGDLGQLGVMFAVMRSFEKSLKKFGYDVDDLGFSLDNGQNLFNDIAIKTLLLYLKGSNIPFGMHIDDHHIGSKSEIGCGHFDLLVRTKNLDTVLWDSYGIRLSDIIYLNRVLKIFASETKESVSVSGLPKFVTEIGEIYGENKILKGGHQECCVVIIESDEFTLRHSNILEAIDDVTKGQIFVYHKSMAEKRNMYIANIWSSAIINHLLSKLGEDKLKKLLNELFDITDETKFEELFSKYLSDNMNVIMFDHLVQTGNNLVKSGSIPVYTMKVDEEGDIVNFSKVSEVGS